ncbi:MAG TPA: serine/threonine-protein kinase [Gemmatimonadaceae bacterium]|nr:serine/threonine-protein kinase [Gemmatimonadaceae bacterium]
MPVDAQESNPAQALRAGALLADRYRVVRTARGTSPFAFSYQAEDLLNGDVVVIKEFFPRSLVSREADGVSVRPHSPDCERDFLRALHRFALEGAVLAEITHPNLVRVRAVVDAHQTVYLVMDRHETQSLAEFVQSSQGRVVPADASRIIQQLLSALELLHAESIIHRDLSPRTVHVSQTGAAILLEFSARRHLPVHATDLAPGFAAFEQYGTKDIGPWTDVYAAAAVFYSLLTGITPPSALERAAGQAVASPLMSVPGLAPGLAGVVMRGMALLPQQRPHAVSELRRQLEGALVDGRPTPARPAYTAPAPAPDLLAKLDAGIGAEYDGGIPLRLAPGGIVVPAEESSSTKLFRKLKNAASRFGGNPTFGQQAQEEDEIEALSRLTAPVAEPPRPTLTQEPVPPVIQAPTYAPIVPKVESALPVAAETPRFELSRQVEIASEEFSEPYATPNRRRRYSLAAAAFLVLAIGSSMILLARSGRASGVRAPGGTSAAPQQRTPGTSAAGAVVPAHESVAGGAVLQSASRSPATDPAVDSPASAAKRSNGADRSVTSAPARSSEPLAGVLPSGRLPNLKIAVAGSAADLKIVPPELLVDPRTRLTNGQDQADQGDYLVARHTFRGAIAQLDSTAAKFPDSQSIKSLRREIEQADSRALQACTAENDMRKRRGEEARACQ